MRSTYSAASADSRSGLSEQGSRQSPFASPILLVSRTSPDGGRTFRLWGTCAHLPLSQDSATSSAGASLVSHSAPPHVAVKRPSICGRNFDEWYRWQDHVGLLLKTSLVSLMKESSGCAVISKSKTIRSGRSIWTLRYLRDNVAGIESSGWPTPTTRYTADSPSMRKWPAYAKYQDRVGRTTPRLWEWMMSFPAGWTASASSAMRSRLTSRKSLGSQS